MAGTSPKELKNRIRSMESTKQITRAMEMVAASRLRHVQDQAAASGPYFRMLQNTMEQIVDSNRDLSSPYLKKRTGGDALFLVIAGDRGLAGGYNSNVLKLAVSLMEGRTSVVLPIGKKAVDFFGSEHFSVFPDGCTEATGMDIADCFRISEKLCKGYLAGDFDEIHVVYTRFVSVLAQTAASIRLLPLERSGNTEKRKNWALTIFEPDAREVFAAIAPEYLGGVLYGALCQSRCAEQAARRTAMDAATRNAEDMIADLRLTRNRARQAAITQEITEIIAGTQA